MLKKLLHVIITGGTIDSAWDGTKDTVVPTKESAIPQYFDSLKIENVQFSFSTVAMKDSRELNDEDRKEMINIIEGSEASNFIITHGTYTIPETARYLKSHSKRKDISVVITGSMIPLHGFTPSDGPFNLGFALAQLEYVKPGIYVGMNGRIFEADDVSKDVSQGRFVSNLDK